MVRQYYKYRFHFADEALQALASITHPNTPTAVAAAVSYMLRNYLREGYVSANKVMRLLQKVAKPGYTPPDNTTSPDATLAPPSPVQSTVKIPPAHSPASPNSSPASLGFVDKYRRKLPLVVAAGGGIVLVVFSIISASPPPELQQQQPSPETGENNTIPETIEEKTKVSTENNTTQKNITEQEKEQNNCIVVTRPANVRAVSGRRRTGKVIKAGTQVTVTGKQDDGWIEISAPEEGWIWGSRTKNTCKAK
jgi:serine/threonine-protein kinase